MVEAQAALLKTWHVFLTLPVITQWGVTSILVAALFAHLVGFTEKTVHDGPSIFTTSGIFFTFLGIAEGLYGFDVHKADASIPILLDGLKTAFIASVAGVGAALSIKLRYALLGLRSEAGSVSSRGADIDDLHDSLIALRAAISGTEDSTLVSQLKLGRQDTNDRLDALQRSQAAFMEKMADQNSKALISALQEVIKDFNVKISEQFGDNFKQLNAAVGQLLTWQENYREILAEISEQQSKAAENMHAATERYTQIVDKAEIFATVSASLSSLLDSLQVQKTQLSASLEALGNLLNAASGSLPQIEEKIIQMTAEVASGVARNEAELTRIFKETSAAMSGAQTKLVAMATDVTQQAAAGVRQSQQDMTKAVREAGMGFQTAIADASRLLAEMVQKSNQQNNDHFKGLADKATEQISKLDVALEQELSKSITSLGKQLAALSSRFVEDYGPLTEKLRSIVQVSSRV